MQAITDWGTALITSFTTALALVFAFIPKLIGFLLILLIGWFVAKALERIVTALLRKVGFDNFSNRIGLNRFDQRMGVHLDAAGILGQIVFWFIFLIFLVPALESLGITSVTVILNQFIAYIPEVFVAILILFLGALLATVVADIVRGLTATAGIGNPNVFAAIARWAILLFAIFMALSQLRIAPAIVELLFSAIVFGSALAFGLAFGLGGRDAAQRLIESGEANMNNAAVQLSTRQTTGQMDTTTRQTIPQDVRNMPQGTQNVAQDVRQQAQQTGSDVQQKAQDLP
jgi:Conserved TM helix